MANLLQVSTITTHPTGTFRRAGFTFTRGQWTTLRMADVDDPAKGDVAAATVDRIKEDKLLVTRVPTAAEVSQLERDMSEPKEDRDRDRMTKLERQVRELQAELASGRRPDQSSGRKPAADADADADAKAKGK